MAGCEAQRCAATDVVLVGGVAFHAVGSEAQNHTTAEGVLMGKAGSCMAVCEAQWYKTAVHALRGKADLPAPRGYREDSNMVPTSVGVSTGEQDHQSGRL